MWIVANQLKGVLKFPGFGIELRPEQEIDLDTLGRERAEASIQVKLALDQGYLRTVRKTLMLDESEVNRMIEERIHSIKASLVSEISGLARQDPVAPTS
ncbi:MAG TPA: hypothetical protein VKW04_17035 [Planctomycetota bacterium]|nr:hypothetical protein [Planctomycetota bacterium]